MNKINSLRLKTLNKIKLTMMFNSKNKINVRCFLKKIFGQAFGIRVNKALRL